MLDREKVIKGMEMCISQNECSPDDCPYYIRPNNESGLCWDRLMTDALSLLKEQEAITIKKTKEHGFGVYGGICPKCRNWIQSAHSFCGFCGQAVKWNV